MASFDPSLNPFQACWDRIDRAGAHSQTAMETWNEYIETEGAYDARLAIDHEGNCTLWMEQVVPIPALLNILIGEWAYNMRAALDYCAYSTAVFDTKQDPPPKADSIQFPIYSNEELFRRNEYRIKPLSKKHRRWLEAVQPYQGELGPKATALYWINELARLDRHRQLHVVGMTQAEGHPLVRVTDESVEEIAILFEDQPTGQFVEREAVVARFKVVPYTLRQTKVEANPNTMFDVEIEQMVRGRPADIDYLAWPMGKRLWMLSTIAGGYIARFERDCAGYTSFDGLRDEADIEASEGGIEPAD